MAPRQKRKPGIMTGIDSYLDANSVKARATARVNWPGVVIVGSLHAVQT
ncbi:MAG: hypothetical protein J07HR59_01745 [Halorubrum sp. J07HR59]|nr:MAG: hypothetical protein J07HR59_01745 [Halorubrum sp. J07HR59]